MTELAPHKYLTFKLMATQLLSCIVIIYCEELVFLGGINVFVLIQIGYHIAMTTRVFEMFDNLSFRLCMISFMYFVLLMWFFYHEDTGLVHI